MLLDFVVKVAVIFELLGIPFLLLVVLRVDHAPDRGDAVVTLERLFALIICTAISTFYHVILLICR
jgi:hypothetical protein